MHKKNSRAAILLVCLALIGGTGCITTAVVNSIEQQAAQNRLRELRKKEIEADLDGAAKGDLMAMTRAGLDYLRGYPYYLDPGAAPILARDLKKGLGLLEQASAQNFGPAQYVLGEVLINDGVLAMKLTERIPPDPTRGLELIKQASTRICEMSRMTDYHFMDNPSSAVSAIYRNGRQQIATDVDQADNWAVRAILTCHVHTRFFTGDRVKNLSFYMLQNDKPMLDSQVANMPPDQVEKARAKLPQLRAAATALEQIYPAPPESIRLTK